VQSGFLASNPAVAFFYLLTAVHGLHLLGGLFVWGRTIVKMARPSVELVDLRLSRRAVYGLLALTCCWYGWSCSPCLLST